MANLVMPRPPNNRCISFSPSRSRSQQPVDKGNGATEHLEVAGIHIHGYRVSASATGHRIKYH
eukprot:scaffold15300_cov23-Cyclotella_meneghiniana.AAC.3